ncbi:MAG TPA: hypothetical protein VHS59_00915, partial [Bacillota bacterium]|nr:hypothetical protein [Bacillota bacterium]
MEQKRYFASISLVRFQVDGVSLNYPDDIFKLYLADYAPKYIKQIISKWQKGKLLTDRDYYLLIKKALGNPCKVRNLSETADLMSVCGVEVKAGRWGILEEARPEVEQKALRFCLDQMLAPFTTPVLGEYFPGEHFNLGFWQEVVEQDRAELDFNIKMAYIFTLYNYQLDMETESRCGYFPDYYSNELKKRLGFIKVMLENRNPGEGLDYIPLFENFRNFNVDKGALMAQMISRILKSQNLGPGEKNIIEDALISHARAAANCRDEEATQLKDKLLNPMVSQVVGLNKSREFLQAAGLC